MKKQQQERSDRYRFWRNVGIITGSGLIGGVIGFLTGMFGSEKPLEIQSFFSKEVLLLGSILLFLILFMVTIALLISARKVHQKMLQIEDEDEAYHYDIQKEKLYGLATIFKGTMILPYFLVIIFYSQLVYMDRPSTGHLAFIFGTFTMLYLFLVLIALFFLSDTFFRKTFHLLYGKPIPRNANAKEVREFLMSMMDEAEKQISYEENYEIIIKLSNYILPFTLIGIFLIGTFFHTDILLALVVVSLIYVYILVSQYKITKRYYKE
ncbi:MULTISPECIES: DUF3169 family protein [unclassified Streptococcus]|uniref:DUF3169 family protein n=1 Tax=unclassified Streptococcus TaxID=2608887 RepID=UPI00263F011A|nr:MULTISPECIES: DUF3169 family protein [unclassified Streptococcus]MDN5022400.1 DUF3169 family protein [Streptococcus sp. SP1]MDN5029449.1 DUF3169 family protein [Streptococcus sp. SP4]